MDALRVVLIQTYLYWQDPEANREHFNAILNDLGTNADLVILPEMFSTGFTMSPADIDPSEGERTLDWMIETASKLSVHLMGSVVYQAKGAFYNRLFCISPDGIQGSYDKRHTFTLAGEDKVYSRGMERLFVEIRGFKICPLICYDLRFPVWSRNTVDYDVLVYVANWPKPRIEAWDALLKARAIENMAYCIGVNRVGTDDTGHEYPGHSSIYDPLGKRMIYSEQPEVLTAELSKEKLRIQRDKLMFLRDRDDFSFRL